jgi:hypothetical protein
VSPPVALTIRQRDEQIGEVVRLLDVRHVAAQ